MPNNKSNNQCCIPCNPCCPSNSLSTNKRREDKPQSKTSCPECPKCPQISNKAPPKDIIETPLPVLDPIEDIFPSSILETEGLPLTDNDLIGMPSFEDMMTPTICQIIEQDKWEEDQDQWFTNPSTGAPVDENDPEIDPPPPPPPVPGCTDPSATNYNPAATVDDGSCVFPPPPVPGCTDPSATNYNPAATVDDGSCVFSPPPTNLQQTPSFSIVSPSGSEMLQLLSERTIDSTMTDHSPEGAAWGGNTNVLKNAMDASMWDGVPFNTAGKTKEEICAWLRPSSPWVVRGLRERYHELNPFPDPINPTVAQVNDWNLEVIRHIRALLGDPTPINHDARLYLECRWADERMFTEAWSASYPSGVLGGNTGPCHINGVRMTQLQYQHCGAAFFPSVSDREPYISSQPYGNDFVKYPELNGYVDRKSRAEGIRYINGYMPWAVKLSEGIVNWICAERLGGHAGPYVGRADGSAGEPYNSPARTKFGCSFWTLPGATGSIWYRGKFSS